MRHSKLVGGFVERVRKLWGKKCVCDPWMDGPASKTAGNNSLCFCNVLGMVVDKYVG